MREGFFCNALINDGYYFHNVQPARQSTSWVTDTSSKLITEHNESKVGNGDCIAMTTNKPPIGQ